MAIAAPLLGAALQVAPFPATVAQVAAQTPAPKAVFIVGPTNNLTDENLEDASRMADQAAADGMDVRRVFFPYATWENVLAHIQGANLVVYMGHGYGWPSPYTSKMTETRQNGFGLNSFEGSGRAAYTYYGATPIREQITLAPNAVVILVHGCYTSGNGEPGMAIPSVDLARARVDNYASGFLAAGARAVFAFGWTQKVNYPRALATSDSTMSELFTTAASGSPAGYIGWRDTTHASVRTPGAEIHLDPHRTYGYYRALTGDLAMSASDWRAGAGQVPAEPTATDDPPQITELVAGSDSASDVAYATTVAPAFHPNGDGLDDVLLMHHTVTRPSYLDVNVRNGAGDQLRAFTAWSAEDAGTSRWDGRDESGAVVPDGHYTLTYVPRDTSGATGDAVSASVLVLTAIALANPTKTALDVSDGDTLARSTTFNVTLNQPAHVTWQIVDAAGRPVRSVRNDDQVPSGTLRFTWDGRGDDGAWVADGTYRSVVAAQTGLGAYSQERTVYVGAFGATFSNGAPARGDQLTLNLISTETLDRNPTVRVTQDGVTPWSVSTRHVKGRRYRASVTLEAGGHAGAVSFLVSAIDSGGGRQSRSFSLPLQ